MKKLYFNLLIYRITKESFKKYDDWFFKFLNEPNFKYHYKLITFDMQSCPAFENAKIQ